MQKLIIGRQCRHAYPIIFFDRQMLIQILYDKIQDKSKVLTSERVTTVQQSQLSATVVTESGRNFTGDVVVGADGIHSKVRQQMWQEAQKADPTWIDPTEEQGWCAPAVSISSN
jgi:2-polyprenyl-6-methoxyphenol hydroxylase-like FAD-dependent oxidoreductase